MTNKMKLVFVLAAVASAIFAVMLSTPFVIDVCGGMLAALGHALGLHESPIASALAVLGIPSLYLIFGKMKRSRVKKGGV